MPDRTPNTRDCCRSELLDCACRGEASREELIEAVLDGLDFRQAEDAQPRAMSPEARSRS
jgi:hypothetical protein